MATSQYYEVASSVTQVQPYSANAPYSYPLASYIATTGWTETIEYRDDHI